jgi:hypothetical protein
MLSDLPSEFNCNEKSFAKNGRAARCWWLTPIILAIQEAELRRMDDCAPNKFKNTITECKGVRVDY